MKYSEFAELYESLFATSKRLEKTDILSLFLKKLERRSRPEWIYLLRGKTIPDYDSREFGISIQLSVKALNAAWGISSDNVLKRYRIIGDIGKITQEFAQQRIQKSLFSQPLEVKKVFDTLNKILDIEGKGAVERKLGLIAELLNSASPLESKYIIRTLLNDLRVGVAESLILDSITKSFFPDEMRDKVYDAYYLTNDFSAVFSAAMKGEKAIDKIEIVPGRPIHVMLPIKVISIDEAFRICGKPAAFEHKYDGFRMVIHKKGDDIKLFTRRLENVTKQFPDVVDAIKTFVKGNSFILDSEVVGYDLKDKKYKPFEAISQRIKRKHNIEKLIHELPVEINVFDVLYYNGESWMSRTFSERRNLLVKIVKPKQFVIQPSYFFITGDEKKAMAFYKNALKTGEEGVMIKKLDAPYRPGRRVGYITKMKPIVKDLDLVIVGAEYGTGKRAGWLTSYVLACKKNEQFLEVGMASSGLKEKAEEGTTYEEITGLLKSLIISTDGTRVLVKPKLVVSVTYQNIQPSPSYSSGFALRFPRISHYRPDRSVQDIATLSDVRNAVKTAPLKD